jgi:REP-associated tyrosine transposase
LTVERERFRRRLLPHWDMPGAAYFVTGCLEGSIPAQGLLEVARYRSKLKQLKKPSALNDREWEIHRWKLAFVKLEDWLDRKPANRILQRPELAHIVVDSMYHFAEQRYDLLAYVAMPSHFHWVFQPRDEWVRQFSDDRRSPRQQIMYSLRRYSAARCNRILERRGAFWQHESYDHWIRDANEMDRVIQYVEENPVKAGLVNEAAKWPVSSARARRQIGAEHGEPLPVTSKPAVG